MKTTLTQEAKYAIIEELKQKIYERKGDYYNDRYVKSGIQQAIEVVESFPLSDGGKQDSSNGWIPVTERLQEERVPVLVRMSYGKFDVCYRLAETFVQDVRPQHSNGGVTHWQALPKSPTK